MTRSIVQRGLYFDELETGVVYEHRPAAHRDRRPTTSCSRTLTMNTQALHLDAAWSAGTDSASPGQQHVHALDAGRALGRAADAGHDRREPRFLRRPLPEAGARRRHPLRARRSCAASGRARSRPGEGIVDLEHTARNQRGEVVPSPSARRWSCSRPAEPRDAGPRPGPALLFCPADRPERFAKAAAAADVGDPRPRGWRRRRRRRPRPGARCWRPPLDPAARSCGSTRPAPRTTPRDLEALGRTAYRTVMLAKTETAAAGRGAGRPAGHRAVRDAARRRQRPAIAAAAPTVALMWGAEDLVAGLGGRSSRFPAARPTGPYRDVARTARSLVLLAAGAHRRLAIDAVHLDIARPRRPAGRGRGRRRLRLRRHRLHPPDAGRGGPRRLPRRPTSSSTGPAGARGGRRANPGCLRVRGRHGRRPGPDAGAERCWRGGRRLVIGLLPTWMGYVMMWMRYATIPGFCCEIVSVEVPTKFHGLLA